MANKKVYKYKVVIKCPMVTEEFIIQSNKDNNNVTNMLYSEHWDFLIFEKQMFNKKDVLLVEFLDD